MMKKERVNMWSALPEEIIDQSITSSGLDLKSMIKFMVVCKRWRNLISDHISDNPLLGAKGDVQFLGYDFGLHRFGTLDEETHEIVSMKTLDSSWRITSYHPPNDEVTLSSSCNGLVCLVSPLHHHYSIYICNPVLGEHISLHKPWFVAREHIFGFCPTSNEYKLAVLSLHSLEIHTLGHPPGSWRTVPLKRPSPEEFVRRAVFVNGVFHWLLETKSILTLDLAKEVLGSTPPPRLVDNKEIYQLGCIGRCLVATAGYRKGDNPPPVLEIWARKEDKSSGELVWTRNWVIDTSLWPQPVDYRFLVPRKLSTDGRIIMTSCHYHWGSLYSYDPRNNRARQHRYTGELHAFDYTPTLVSPEKLMQNKRTRTVGD